MFEGYRELLRIACDEEWHDEKNRQRVEKFLTSVDAGVVDYNLNAEGFVLLDVLKKLLSIAFRTKDRELLCLALGAVVELDGTLDDKERIIVESRGYAATGEEETIKGEEEEAERGAEDTGRKIRHKSLSGVPLFGDGEILSRKYGSKVYRPVLDHILKNIPARDFSTRTVRDAVFGYYRDVLGRKLEPGSVNNYANAYRRYMIAEKMITADKLTRPIRAEVDSLHLTPKGERMTGVPAEAPVPTGKVRRFSLSKHAQYIIQWAEKNGTDLLDVELMMQNKIMPVGHDYRMRDICEGFGELMELGVATRLGKKRYGLKRDRIVDDG